MEKYNALLNILFLTQFHKGRNNFAYFQIVTQRYLVMLVPVILITLGIHIHQPLLQIHRVGSVGYLQFLLLSGLITPCIAQTHLFNLLGHLNYGSVETSKQGRLKAFFGYLPTLLTSNLVTTTVFIAPLAYIMNFDLRAALSFFTLMVLNSLFASFISIIGQVKKNYLWINIWLIYIVTFYLFPLMWYLPAGLACLAAALYLWQTNFRFNKIQIKSIFTFSMLQGFFLALVIWFDKIIIYVFFPNSFAPEYVFISLIPCILTLNYFFVFVQRPLNKRVSTLIWGISKYSIANYLNYGQLALKDLNKSLINIFIFCLGASALTYIIAEIYLPNKFLLSLNLIIGLLVTLMTILLNIQLYFSRDIMFFIGPALFMVGVALITIFDGIHSTPILMTALALFYLGFRWVSKDLIRHWETPHKNLLKLT